MYLWSIAFFDTITWLLLSDIPEGGVSDTTVGFSNRDMCMQPEDATIIRKANRTSVSMQLPTRQCELYTNLKERFLFTSGHNPSNNYPTLLSIT
jgi:hypothetical protein